MYPLLVYDKGMSFGELALLKRAPRAGTVVTLTDCFFATITADSYERVLKRNHTRKLSQNVMFLNTIPYMHGWLDRHT